MSSLPWDVFFLILSTTGAIILIYHQNKPINSLELAKYYKIFFFKNSPVLCAQLFFVIILRSIIFYEDLCCT